MPTRSAASLRAEGNDRRQSQSYLPACAKSLLKNTLQGKRDKGKWRLFPRGFVNLGSTSRPVDLPRGFRVSGTRAPTSGGS